MVDIRLYDDVVCMMYDVWRPDSYPFRSYSEYPCCKTVVISFKGPRHLEARITVHSKQARDCFLRFEGTCFLNLEFDFFAFDRNLYF